MGIIPAHAGNTSRRQACSTRSRDHPRACGEHLREIGASTIEQGSSPRMRGTLGNGCISCPTGGIIPAHAGNTPWPRARSRPTRDHPRACGEHVAQSSATSRLMGSSPRMRGTLCVCFVLCGCVGIIPAHAGNTGRRCGFGRSAGDHPRACGEHAKASLESAWTAGSSPRMRGTRICASLLVFAPGIIPAHAGNTSCSGSWHCCARDHPRACGEHRRTPTGRAPGSGIIPAHAGNTL